VNLALLIASLVAAAIQGLPSISQNIKQLVSAIAGSLSAVLSSGVTSNITPATVYAAIDGVLTQLMKDPALPQNELAVLASLNDALQAAIQADKQAQTGVDPTKIQPITPVP
jgi:hypothetical protein